jgi:HSP20 family molecular chaperone IbpA
VTSTAGAKSPRALGGPDAAETPHRRYPNIEHHRNGEADNFEDTAHGYDCFMRPRKDRDRLVNEMEELFADLCQVPRLVASRHGFRPAVDVYRSEDPPTFIVVVELAGVDPDSTELALGDGQLVIRGARRRNVGERRVVHMEIDYGPFERRIQITEPVDAEAAEAVYTRGLLVVTLPVTKRTGRAHRVVITTRGSA